MPKQTSRPEREREAHGEATWKWCEQYGQWYIALTERTQPPYLRQIHVEAIVDLDAEGRVCGIEIVDPDMPAPPSSVEVRDVE